MPIKNNMNQLNNAITFSIITVCYNSEKTLARTIDSVLNQTFNNFEYIIVDGNSKDSTISIAKSYIESFKLKGIPFTIISEPDKGIYDAMNKGIDIAVGKYIGIINSDDWYEVNALRIVYNKICTSYPNVVIGAVNIIKNGSVLYTKYPKQSFIKSSTNWSHTTSFISKLVYEKLGKYLIRNIYDDFDLFLRIVKSKIPVLYIKDIIGNFSLGGVSSKKSISQTFHRIKSKYLCYRSNRFSFLYIFHIFFIEIIKTILS